MKKRIVAVLLCAVMALSAAACGSDEKKGGTDSASNVGSSSVSSSSEEGEPNEWGWVVPEETLVVSVYGGEGDQQSFLEDETGGKAALDAWLLENLNVQIDWTYTSQTTESQLNLWLTTGEYPAVLTNLTDDQAQKFIDQGKAVDITDYLAEYGDNILRRYGDYMNLLKDDEGRIYKLANYWGDNPNVAGYDFGIRYDLWSELGEDKIYETPEGYYEALKAIVENHPTTSTGQTVYGVTSADEGASFLNAMLAAYGFVSSHKVDEATGEMTHWLNTDEGLEIAKFVNKLYREGLIHPDYLSHTYEDYMTLMRSEQIIGNFGTWWYGWTGGHQYWATEDADNYYVEKRIANVAVHGEGVAMEDVTLLTNNYLGSYRCIITDKCEDVASVIKYLNWESSELGNFILGFGEPHEDNVWKINEEGIWEFDDEIMDVDRKDDTYHAVKDKFGGMTYSIAMNTNWLTTNEVQNFDLIDPRVDRVSGYDYWPVNEDGTFADEGINISWGFYNVEAADTSLFSMTYDDSISTIRATITDNINTWWAEMVTADTEEACEAAFYSAREAANQIGLEQLSDYIEAGYNANAAKLSGE